MFIWNGFINKKELLLIASPGR